MKKKSAKSVTANDTDWVKSIANLTQTSEDTVRSVLAKYRIEAQPTLPRSRTICIRSIEFSGVKDGTFANNNFSFVWKGLGPGLWAVMSDVNSRGKSSVLNILRSALQGDFPGRIKPDIWKWLSHINVEFTIDRTTFRVLVEKKAGEERGQSIVAALSRQSEVEWIDLYRGPPGEMLENQTSALFMDELAFAKVHAFNSKHSVVHSHGWPALSSALFISDPGNAIFGDNTTDALPLRILQLFMGLPWVSTHTAAQVAVKQFEIGSKNHAENSPDAAKHLKARLAALNERLNNAKEKKTSKFDRESLRQGLSFQDNELAELHSLISSTRDEVGGLKNQLLTANTELVEARRTFQYITDEQSAGYLFRRLRPVCCPACESDIEARKYETSDASGVCALCGTDDSDSSEDYTDIERLEGVRGDIDDVQNTANNIASALKIKEQKLQALLEKKVIISNVIKEIQDTLNNADDDLALEREIIGLESTSNELRELIASIADPVTEPLEHLLVLKATVEVTKKMFQDLQDDILADISAELTRISIKFGVENITEMSWKANGSLFIQQGGSNTSFTKLSAGEKLRVRIASALAVLEVARRRGYGRHPGLLVLDSPGSQEMAEGDFAALLAGVNHAVSSSQNIQVLVGAIAKHNLTDTVPVERQFYAKGKEFLF